jgi:hypothetical protein
MECIPRCLDEFGDSVLNPLKENLGLELQKKRDWLAGSLHFFRGLDSGLSLQRSPRHRRDHSIVAPGPHCPNSVPFPTHRPLCSPELLHSATTVANFVANEIFVSGVPRSDPFFTYPPSSTALTPSSLPLGKWENGSRRESFLALLK